MDIPRIVLQSEVSSPPHRLKALFALLTPHPHCSLNTILQHGVASLRRSILAGRSQEKDTGSALSFQYVALSIEIILFLRLYAAGCEWIGVPDVTKAGVAAATAGAGTPQLNRRAGSGRVPKPDLYTWQWQHTAVCLITFITVSLWCTFHFTEVSYIRCAKTDNLC